MRKVLVSEFITLDGVVEDPGGAEKTPHGGWTWPYWNDEIGQLKQDELFAGDALLLGRVTYQGFAAAWPSATDEYGFADRMNSLPKYVATTTLDTLDWNNSTALTGDVAEAVAALKQQPGGDILVFGSGGLIQTLMRHNLVDEYCLLVYPVVIGGGKRLFADGIPSKLKLVESRPFSSGVVMLRYQMEPASEGK
ncbi:MAG TPA: dihydrofolate reductase family protein [Ktedonobacterales bacterium]